MEYRHSWDKLDLKGKEKKKALPDVTLVNVEEEPISGGGKRRRFLS